MACQVHNQSPISWSLVVDDEWDRDYEVTHLVKGEKTKDTPYSASHAVGLPMVGSIWAFGDEIDQWAFCRPGKSIKVHQEQQGEIDVWFTVTQRYSTRPLKKCEEEEITDPLLKPHRISGSSIRDKEEAMYDRHGQPVVNSAHEQIRGPQNEWDISHSQYVVEQNVLMLERNLIEPMRDTLNDAPLWGFPARSIKLSDFRWTENYYGTCYKYYTRTLTFDVRVKRFNIFNPFPVYEGTPFPGPIGTLLIPDWDRDLLDEGTKCLNGQWDPAQGTGFTFNIAALDDADGVTAGTMGTAGTGYPKSAIVPLFLDHPGIGEKAVILVETDVTGVPFQVISVHKAGTGYALGGNTTTQRGFWVLKRIGGAAGVAPDYNDPQHFMRFQDPKGNQSRCLLDGKGMPIAIDETPGHIHVEKYDESNFLLLGLPDLPQ